MTLSKNTEDWGIVGILVTVVVIFAFAMASVTVDTAGRKDWNHAGPVPRGIEQLDNRAYLVEKGARPAQACHKVARTSRTSSGKLYVVCSSGQTWDDQRPVSKNLGGSIVEQGQHYWWLYGGLVALGWLGFLICVLSDYRYYRQRMKVVKLNNAKLLEEAKVMWAQDKITTDQLEQKVQELS